MPKLIDNFYAKAAVIGLMALLTVLAFVYRSDQTPVEAQTSVPATFSFIRYTYNQKTPFKLNTIKTTKYGPPWADVVVHPANMVSCESKAPIALCYYSGPQGTVPCNQDGLGIANCTCYEIPTASQGNKQPYLVDINAILNEEVYLQTIATCGPEGRGCKPIGSKEAPVCNAINNNTFIPGADLISTFSLYLEKDMPIHETNCPISDYAGCMTAPCKRTGEIDPKTKLPLVQCGCPVYKGPYQVGTTTDQCELGGSYVWSAAYRPTPTPTPK